jgi:hypothetical protein
MEVGKELAILRRRALRVAMSVGVEIKKRFS